MGLKKVAGMDPSKMDASKMMESLSPEMLEASMNMFKNMSPEQMDSMSGMMGGMGLKKEDVARMQDSMKNMKPEDLKKYLGYAQKAQKCCAPLWKVFGPCLTRVGPLYKKLNVALGGQARSFLVCAGAIGFYFYFMA